MSSGVLDISILGPALAAGLLVLATHVPLGQHVLKRGIIFIDLAIAQVAGLGAMAAHLFFEEWGPIGAQATAVSAALLAALLLNASEKRWPDIQEALIGALFVLAASAGLLLLAGNPHGGENLKELLVGQILWVTPSTLLITLVTSLAVLVLWFGVRERLGTIGFYVLFAVSVTASVQLVGIYLVFASLILPALATRQLSDTASLGWGYLIGITGYTLGIVLSALVDLPTGAVVVWALALSALVVALGLRVRTVKHRR